MKRFKEICHKNQEENYLLDKYALRHISIVFTILFIKLRATPNQTTLLSLLAALGSLFFLTSAEGPYLLVGACLIFAYSILDHVDGELARYYIYTGKHKPSLQGHYFDILVHRYSSNLMVFFLSLGLYHLYGHLWLILLGFVAAMGLSSFPNGIASQVIAGEIAQHREIINNKTMKEILSLVENKERQIESIQSHRLVVKLKKLLIEVFFFPGHIILLTLALVGDYIIHGFEILSFSLNFRLLLLFLLAAMYSLKTLAQSLLWVIRLKKSITPSSQDVSFYG